ncbi:hypothetical protein SZ40_02190, partial [Brachyspira hyodysenteriae]|uniref:hypothetical protein n=1 Tax=Brachyspira hyodysenteriae TaxID=159 RepID=UPI00063DD5DE
MEKEFASIFESNKDISLDEYEINKLLEKSIEINENEFPVIAIGNSDKETPKIHGKITTKEYEEKDNKVVNNYSEDKEGLDVSNNAYSEEETKNYKNLQETLSLSESDIEVAGGIVDSEIDMSRLFPNSDNSNNLDKEETEVQEEEPEKTSELTEEQSEIINNIYSKEESNIHKQSEDESLEGYELSNIETVEDFNLDDSFKKDDSPTYYEEEEKNSDLHSAENDDNASDESDLNSLEDNLKELSDDIKGDNKSIEDIDIEDLIGEENTLNVENIKDESIRLGESDLNNLEDTLKDLPNDANNDVENAAPKDINIEDLIGENIEYEEEYDDDDTSEEESGLELREYTDEELLDINNILDDEEIESNNKVPEESAQSNEENSSALEELENIEESIDENPE